MVDVSWPIKVQDTLVMLPASSAHHLGYVHAAGIHRSQTAQAIDGHHRARASLALAQWPIACKANPLTK